MESHTVKFITVLIFSFSMQKLGQGDNSWFSDTV